ncbi:MAG: MCE family protein [Oligosphaeraceae bacterium]|nr:MCE family protein [Oligosphaeraceae bacterium]
MTVFLVVALGGQKLFASAVDYKVFFDKSVKGLSIGSPVMFRGVRIGQVSHISLSYQAYANDARQESWPIAVTISLSPQAMGMKTSWMDSLPNPIRSRLLQEDSHGKLRLLLSYLVETEGMRAQLQSLSLLTGQLFIEMNFFPQSPFTPEMRQDLENDILPVQMSAFERLFLSLENRDFSTYLETFYLAMEDFSSFVSSGKFRRLLNDFSQTGESFNSLLKDGKQGLQPLLLQASGTLVRLEAVLNKLDQAVEPVRDDLQNSMQRVVFRTEAVADQISELTQASRQFMEHLDQLVVSNEPQITALLEGLVQNSRHLGETMQETRNLLQSARDNLGADSPVQGKLEEALSELQRSALALRNLAEYLRRNPEALIRGKDNR